MPSAFGATDFPTKNISTTIVRIYGMVLKISEGIKFELPKSTVKLCAKANNKHALYVPNGVHFPKITAASAMNPWPQMVAGEN